MAIKRLSVHENIYDDVIRSLSNRHGMLHLAMEKGVVFGQSTLQCNMKMRVPFLLMHSNMVQRMLLEKLLRAPF